MKQVNGQGNISDALLACSITFPIQMVIAFAIAIQKDTKGEEEEQEGANRFLTLCLFAYFTYAISQIFQ